MEDNFQLVAMWLSGNRDYRAGTEIHARLSNNYILKSMFSSPETEYLSELLDEEMNSLLLLFGAEQGESKAEIIEKAVDFVSNIANHNIRASDLPNAPEYVKKARNARRNLYNKYLRLRELLKDYIPIEMRKNAALEILSIMDEIKPLWDITNYYDDYPNELPEDEETEEKKLNQLSTSEQNKLYDSIYKYIRKNAEDPKKRQICIKKITIAEELKNLLIEKNAFSQHNRTFPKFD